MITFKQFLNESFLKLKRVSPISYQVTGTNAFIIKMGREWELRTGDDAYDAENHGGWIQSFSTKNDALKWLEDDPKRARNNGVVLV